MPRTALGLLLATALGFAPALASAQALPGTKPWPNRGDAAAAMVAGMHRFLDREAAQSVDKRPAQWHRNFASPAEYEASVAPNRTRLRTITGAVGERVSPVELSYVATFDAPARVAETPKITVDAVRWSVYPGVDAEGLYLRPKGQAHASAVVMADCDTTPEQAVGLSPGLEPDAQVARLLAEAGCQVLVPTLIDRSDEFSGNPAVMFTNQPHREWIYRQAYETGRHIIGYEVDKVRAAIDWFQRDAQPRLPMAVVGFGEGGLIAFYTAAIDTRIDAAWVGAYFGPREKVWREPIYRNVWGLLDEFGDAEIASLIAPRILFVENSPQPHVTGPPPARKGRTGAASGMLTPIATTTAKAELQRGEDLLKPLIGDRPLRYYFQESPTANASDTARKRFLSLLPGLTVAESEHVSLTDARPHFDTRARMKRQVEQLVAYTQGVIRTSELRRYAYWSRADMSSPAAWERSIVPYREAFHTELIGALPRATEPPVVKTVKLYDEPRWTGYGVELPVWPDVVASGILLLPKDLTEGERRPVVVCQHGLEGRPEDVCDPKLKNPYNAYAAQLAERGYIVYAPQNPYIGKDDFRLLQRKANPLKKSLFSLIVGQHDRTLDWLVSLPYVDPERIAFYGLSYGGKTAMRVPAILTRYCLSICSADFNEWVVKNTNLDRNLSYMFKQEYDMYEFGLAERFNYAEMAALIAPRPFQVERGHKDGVAPDEWIGYEFAKVKRTFDMLGLADRVDITYFNDGHQIEGKGTFAFLARHLKWPRGQQPLQKTR